MFHPIRMRKGNLRFPLDEPIPYTLIRRIVKFRVKEQLERVKPRQGREVEGYEGSSGCEKRGEL